MARSGNLIAAGLMRWAAQRRFPTLLGIVGSLFVVDLIVPDFVPFVDELILGLGTVVLARWKAERRGLPAEAQSDQRSP